jgi:glycosyltransferase involved in cell wall biosynthesis
LPRGFPSDIRQPIAVVQTIAGTAAHHGGTSRSVPALCDALAAHAEITLVTAAPRGRRDSACLPLRARSIVVPEPLVLGRLLSALQFRRAVGQALHDGHVDVLHDHGVWLPSNRMAARASAALGVVRVVSPRGMLSPWSMAHRGGKKRLAWQLYQRRDLATAAGFHATSEKEAEEIRSLGFRQPIAVVPNGIATPERSPGASRTGAPRVALFLSRLHPKKGVLELLRAWSQVPRPAWVLWLAGPDGNGYRHDLEAEIAGLGLQSTVSLLGSVRDEDKWDLYARASLFVLPSWDENFGIVVAEALASGLPVIATTATPWAIVEQVRAGWFVPPGVDGVRRALEAACALPPETLVAMGARGRIWAESALGWPNAAQQMLRFYEWLLDRRLSTPACVWT